MLSPRRIKKREEYFSQREREAYFNPQRITTREAYFGLEYPESARKIPFQVVYRSLVHHLCYGVEPFFIAKPCKPVNMSVACEHNLSSDCTTMKSLWRVLSLTTKSGRPVPEKYSPKRVFWSVADMTTRRIESWFCDYGIGI